MANLNSMQLQIQSLFKETVFKFEQECKDHMTYLDEIIPAVMEQLNGTERYTGLVCPPTEAKRSRKALEQMQNTGTPMFFTPYTSKKGGERKLKDTLEDVTPVGGRKLRANAKRTIEDLERASISSSSRKGALRGNDLRGNVRRSMRLSGREPEFQEMLTPAKEARAKEPSTERPHSKKGSEKDDNRRRSARLAMESENPEFLIQTPPRVRERRRRIAEAAKAAATAEEEDEEDEGVSESESEEFVAPISKPLTRAQLRKSISKENMRASSGRRVTRSSGLLVDAEAEEEQKEKDLIKQREAEAKALKKAQEKEKRELAKKKKAEEEAERQRIQAEEEAKAKKKAEQEAERERKRQEKAAEAKRRKEERERQQKEKEAAEQEKERQKQAKERLRKEREEAKLLAEKKRKEEQERARKQKMEEEARQKKEEMKRAREEAAAERKRLKEAEALAKQKAKEALEAKKEKERLRLEREKERERIRLEKEEAKAEKERLRLEKEKKKEQERKRLEAEKEKERKEKERQRLAKEKERKRQERLKEREEKEKQRQRELEEKQKEKEVQERIKAAKAEKAAAAAAASNPLEELKSPRKVVGKRVAELMSRYEQTDAPASAPASTPTKRAPKSPAVIIAAPVISKEEADALSARLDALAASALTAVVSESSQNRKRKGGNERAKAWGSRRASSSNQSFRDLLAVHGIVGPNAGEDTVMQAVGSIPEVAAEVGEEAKSALKKSRTGLLAMAPSPCPSDSGVSDSEDSVAPPVSTPVKFTVAAPVITVNHGKVDDDDDEEEEEGEEDIDDEEDGALKPLSTIQDRIAEIKKKFGASASASEVPALASPGSAKKVHNSSKSDSRKHDSGGKDNSADGSSKQSKKMFSLMEQLNSSPLDASLNLAANMSLANTSSVPSPAAALMNSLHVVEEDQDVSANHDLEPNMFTIDFSTMNQTPSPEVEEAAQLEKTASSAALTPVNVTTPVAAITAKAQVSKSSISDDQEDEEEEEGEDDDDEEEEEVIVKPVKKASSTGKRRKESEDVEEEKQKNQGNFGGFIDGSFLNGISDSEAYNTLDAEKAQNAVQFLEQIQLNGTNTSIMHNVTLSTIEEDEGDHAASPNPEVEEKPKAGPQPKKLKASVSPPVVTHVVQAPAVTSSKAKNVAAVKSARKRSAEQANQRELQAKINKREAMRQAKGNNVADKLEQAKQRREQLEREERARKEDALKRATEREERARVMKEGGSKDTKSAKAAIMEKGKRNAEKLARQKAEDARRKKLASQQPSNLPAPSVSGSVNKKGGIFNAFKILKQKNDKAEMMQQQQQQQQNKAPGPSTPRAFQKKAPLTPRNFAAANAPAKSPVPVPAKQMRSPKARPSPLRKALSPVNEGNGTQYSISPCKMSDAEPEEPKNPKKREASWAKREALAKLMRIQNDQMNADDVFGAQAGVTCNLEEVFDNYKPRPKYRNRTSSAQWSDMGVGGLSKMPSAFKK